MIVLENEHLALAVSKQGAEIRSIVQKDTAQEQMWSGDAAYWGRVSPVLFPIVGKLYDDQYHVDGRRYSLPQHGFLRDQTFQVKQATLTRVVFEWFCTAETLEHYPFQHHVEIEYVLQGGSISVRWHVFNDDARTMFYSIGAHPAFVMEPEDVYEITVEPKEDLKEIPFSDGYIGRSAASKRNRFPVNETAFKNDTIIFEALDAITLHNRSKDTSIRIDCKDFLFVGVWSPKKEGELAPFVCLEPWMGIADTKGGSTDIADKFAIQHLKPKESKLYHYEVTFQ